VTLHRPPSNALEAGPSQAQALASTTGKPSTRSRPPTSMEPTNDPQWEASLPGVAKRVARGEGQRERLPTDGAVPEDVALDGAACGAAASCFHVQHLWPACVPSHECGRPMWDAPCATERTARRTDPAWKDRQMSTSGRTERTHRTGSAVSLAAESFSRAWASLAGAHPLPFCCPCGLPERSSQL
jgi:hypothetical protein